jgi:hypothetical protein
LDEIHANLDKLPAVQEQATPSSEVSNIGDPGYCRS